MKAIVSILFAFLLTHLLMSQVTYKTGMVFTFSGGNNMGAPIGNDCGNKDIDIFYNSIDGNMEVTVNKLCHSWSFVQHWMGGSYAPKPVFKNRYIEMRIQSTAPHDSLSIAFQVTGGAPDGSGGKSIPTINYKINQANTWEIKLFKLGGDADTVFKEIDYNFPNGFYIIDYVFYGDAAVPKAPVMDPIKDQVGKERGKVHSIDIYAEIPDRLLDGLIIEAKPVSANHFFDTVSIGIEGCFLDGQCPFNVLNYKISEKSTLTSDSILITLKDTIRGTSSEYKFSVSAFPLNLSDNQDNIKVYPTLVESFTTLEFTTQSEAQIEIINTTGACVYSTKIEKKSSETLDLTALSAGIYFVKISEDNNCIIKKIIKK